MAPAILRKAMRELISDTGADQTASHAAPRDGGPVAVLAKRVVTSATHTCAILEDGRLKCWGSNLYGSLGLGDARQRGDGSDGGAMGNDLPSVDLGAGRTAIDVSIGGPATARASP